MLREIKKCAESFTLLRVLRAEQRESVFGGFFSFFYHFAAAITKQLGLCFPERQGICSCIPNRVTGTAEFLTGRHRVYE